MVWFSIPELDGIKFQWYGRMPTTKWRILREYVFNRDKGLCRYCETPVELNKCHIHHTLELQDGGTNYPTNLKTLCVKCHKERHPFMKSIMERIKPL